MSSSVPRFHVQHGKYTLFKPVETMIKNGTLEPKNEIQNPGTGLMQVGTPSNQARRGTKTFRNNRTGQIAQRPKVQITWQTHSTVKRQLDAQVPVTADRRV